MIRGKVWKFGNDVSTDLIFPGKYLFKTMDGKELAKHALEGLDPTFAGKVKRGDIVVAGSNFGCGSSREEAPASLKEAGVGAVVAKSFSRLFFRNAINDGLLAVECAEAVERIGAGEEIEIDVDTSEIRCRAGVYGFGTLPKSILEILMDGGLLAHLRKLGNK